MYQRPRARHLRHLTVLLPLLAAACNTPAARNSQGDMQPQQVSGSCSVQPFIPVPFQSTPVSMQVNNAGPACTMTLQNPNGALALTGAQITAQPSQGRAAAIFGASGQSAVINYYPRAGYTGPDRFSVMLQPNNIGLSVSVTTGPNLGR